MTQQLRDLEVSDHFRRYMRDTLIHESAVKQRLRAETASLPRGIMQISADQGAFLRLMAGLIGAKRVLEVGTFTGYSSVCLAEGVGAGGRVTTCDMSEEWTAIARRYWREAGVEDRVELRMGDAIDTLTGLLTSGGDGQFDMAFIDPFRERYDQMYELCLRLVRPNGLIAMDNVVKSGSRHGTDMAREFDDAMHALNQKLAGDARVEAVPVTIGSGLWLARKRP